MPRIFFIAVSWFLVVAGPAFAAEYTEAMKRCVAQLLPEMDDGVSSAEIVADTLGAMCHQQHRREFVELVTGHSSAWRIGYFNAEKKYFAGYVLFYRAHKSH